MQVEPSTEISTWLVRARDELGLSRQALATAAGISEGTLRNAELRRHRISRQTATRLIQEIAKRDALLAYSAPSPLLEAGLTEAQRADRALPMLRLQRGDSSRQTGPRGALSERGPDLAR